MIYKSARYPTTLPIKRRHDSRDGSKLLSGRFGNSSIIRLNSSEWYRSRGVDLTNIPVDYRVHPLVERELFLDTQYDRGSEILLAMGDDLTRSLLSSDHSLDAELRVLVENRIGSSAALNPYGSEDILRSSIGVLNRTIPELWNDVGTYLGRVYIAPDNNLAGVSWTDTLGAVCLGMGKARTPWEGAANLFHEALHAKTARTTRSFELFNPDRTPECIEIPWWSSPDGKTLWDIKRCIDALYVYTHLTEFFHAQSALDPEFSRVPYARSAFRAPYLAGVLRDMPVELFGKEWVDLVIWLISLAPEPKNLTPEGQRALDSAHFPQIDPSLRQKERTRESGGLSQDI